MLTICLRSAWKKRINILPRVREKICNFTFENFGWDWSGESLSDSVSQTYRNRGRQQTISVLSTIVCHWAKLNDENSRMYFFRCASISWNGFWVSESHFFCEILSQGMRSKGQQDQRTTWLQDTNLTTLKPYNFPTLQHDNLKTLKPYNLTTLQH